MKIKKKSKTPRRRS